MKSEKIKIYKAEQTYRANKNIDVFKPLIKEFYHKKMYTFSIEVCEIAIEHGTEKIGKISEKLEFYYEYLIASYLSLNEMEIANNLYEEYIYFNKTLESQYFDFKTIFMEYSQEMIEEAREMKRE